MSSFDNVESRKIAIQDGGDDQLMGDRALLINAVGHCEPAEPADIIHAWGFRSSASNPCGCTNLAKVMLADVHGGSAAVAQQAGASNSTVIHRFACDRCGEPMIVVQNQSGRKTWIANAYQLDFGLEWVDVPIPADVVCFLHLNTTLVSVAPPASADACACAPSASDLDVESEPPF